jgi:hypothetical protein
MWRPMTVTVPLIMQMTAKEVIGPKRRSPETAHFHCWWKRDILRRANVSRPGRAYRQSDRPGTLRHASIDRTRHPDDARQHASPGRALAVGELLNPQREGPTISPEAAARLAKAGCAGRA